MPFRSASRIYRLVLRLVPCRPASRFAYRPASRLASRLAFRFSYRSCVSSCVLSLRFAFLVCPLVMVFDTGAVSSCSPLVLRSAVCLVLRAVPASRAMPFVRLALRFALRLVIVSRFSACPWAMAFDEAPFRPACRLPSRLACRSSVSPLRAVLRPVFITRFARLRSSSVGGVFPAAPFLFARCSSYAVPCHVVPDDPDGLDETGRTTRRSSGTRRGNGNEGYWTELMNDGTRRRMKERNKQAGDMGNDETNDEKRSGTKNETRRGRNIGTVSPCSSLVPFRRAVRRFCLVCALRSRLPRALPCSHPPLVFSHRALSGTGATKQAGRGMERRRWMRANERSTEEAIWDATG